MMMPKLAVFVCVILLIYDLPESICRSAFAGNEATDSCRWPVAQTYSENLFKFIQDELPSKLTGARVIDGYQPYQTIVFQYQVDTTIREYSISIFITRDEWKTFRLFSLPLLFNRYQNCYFLDSRVMVENDGRKIFEYEMKLKKKGDVAFQLLYNEPKDPAVTMTQGKRLEVELALRREMARNITSKLAKNMISGVN